ncbi:MAG TPA: STT3 domain-containing protein [Thermoanaerobaculia bacterium]|nr:STT3 domain-containing protein [Thermoanaerobaculia bacterium]
MGGVPQIPPFDEMYHAKRIVYSAANPMRVLSFDPNRGIAGAYCPWPPLYDLTAGAAARLLGGVTPAGVVARAAWFPVVFASLVAAVIAAFLSRRIGWGTGLLAGVGVAISTDFIDRSRLGSIDHHFLEFPLVLGIVAAVALVHRATDAREALRNGTILGIAMTAALLVQTALLLTGAIVLATVLLRTPGGRFARWAAAVGFLLSAAFVFLYRGGQPPGYPDDHWYLGISHAAALAAAGTACVAQVWLLDRGAGRATAALLSLAPGLLVIASVPGAPEALLSGSRFLGGDPWLASIVEFKPLFFGAEELWWADVALLGGGFFLTAGMAANPLWRRGGRALLLAFALAYSLAAISSARFLAVSAPLCAVTGAIAVSDLRRTRGALAGGLAATVLLVSSLPLTAGRVVSPAPRVTPDMVPFLQTAAFLRSPAAAPGRVLAPWSYGHLLNVVGGRAVLLDNFGTMGGQVHFENATAATLATEEKTLADYCADSGVRYVVLQDPLPYFGNHAETAGYPRSAFERPSTIRGTADSATPLMKSTFWWRAYFEGGRERPGRREGAAFRRFRLVRVERAPPPASIRSTVQVWELVEP